MAECASNQALPDGLRHGFGLGPYMQLAVNGAEVHVHGVKGNRQMVGDFLFDQSLDQAAKDIFLSTR